MDLPNAGLQTNINVDPSDYLVSITSFMGAE